MCQHSTLLGAFMTSYITLTFISHCPELGHMATPSCTGVLLGIGEELIQGRQLAVSVSCGLIHGLDFALHQVLTYTEYSCCSEKRCEIAYLFALPHHLDFCLLSSHNFIMNCCSLNDQRTPVQHLAIMWKPITCLKFLIPKLHLKTYIFCVFSLLGTVKQLIC